MPPPQQQSQSDTSLSQLWVIIGLFAGILAFWYAFHEYIVLFILKLKLFEVIVLDWFTGSDFHETFIQPAKGYIQYMAVNPRQVTFSHLWQLSDGVGKYLRLPFGLILIGLAYSAYRANPTLRFKTYYSMKKLMDAERKNWPQITPVMNLDLVSQHVNKGKWAMSITPMDFAKKHKLIKVINMHPPGGEPPEVELEKAEAAKLLTMQMGKLWTGIDGLAPHRRALFAVFTARMNHDRKTAIAVLGTMAKSSETGQMDYSSSEKLLKKYFNTKGVQRVIASHAYELTVMATMIRVARLDGVLASADFLWLKPIDRPLWYMLNTVGRQTPVIEVAGPFAHWLAELDLGRRLFVPMVDEAVKGLDVAMHEVIYSEEEDDNSNEETG